MNQRFLNRIEKLEKQLDVKKKPEVFTFLHDLFEDEKNYRPKRKNFHVKISEADIEKLLNESELRTGLKPVIFTMQLVPARPDLMKYAPKDEYEAWLKEHPPKKYERYIKKYPLIIQQYKDS